MKEDMTLYQWVPKDKMWAYALTKEIQIPEGLRKVMINGDLELEDKKFNKVVFIQYEIKMFNKRNRGKGGEGDKIEEK